MRQLTGRIYQIDWSKISPEERNEMTRFIRDAEYEMRVRARRAQLTPWRRP
jgi:hypothetical protein